MKITWLGHSCFLFESEDGTRVVSDPFDGSIGYSEPSVRTDAATLSHDHFDHNHFESLSGDPVVIRDEAEKKVGAFSIHGIKCFHDESHGSQRGENMIYIYEADGLRIAHMGDLGHIPTEEQYEKIGSVDVMLIPVGGTFTVDADHAMEIVSTAAPRIAIPMHYQTGRLTLSKTLDGVDRFLALADEYAVLSANEIDVHAGDGKKGIYVLTARD